MDAIVTALHTTNEAPQLSSFTGVITNRKKLLLSRNVLLVIVSTLCSALSPSFVCIYTYIDILNVL